MTLMTAEHQEAGVGKCLVDELNLCYHPLLPVQITGPEQGHEESTLRFRELKTVELQTTSIDLNTYFSTNKQTS